MSEEAVRWARRVLQREMSLDYSKWHATRDYNFTLCGISIPLALEGTFLPETDDIQKVNCGNCLRVLTYRSMKDRYWSKVEKRGPNECWEWQAKRMSDGYGQIKVSGKWLSAHRLSWEFRNGTIPEGMGVLHHCDNPPCVNPDHLFIGTAQDNWDDAKAKEALRAGERR